MKYVNVFFGAVVALFLTSCSDEVKDAARGVQQSVTSPELMATWASGCNDEAFFNLAATQRFYVFNGAESKEVWVGYSDGDCKEPQAEIIWTGDFKVKGDVPSIQDAKRIRVTHEKAYVRALNDEAKGLLEGFEACGVKTWEVNKKVDVSDQEGDLNCPIGDLPYIAETAAVAENDVLYLGEWKTGDAVEEAVESVDRNNPFSKSDKTFE